MTVGDIINKEQRLLKLYNEDLSRAQSMMIDYLIARLCWYLRKEYNLVDETGYKLRQDLYDIILSELANIK